MCRASMKAQASQREDKERSERFTLLSDWVVARARECALVIPSSEEMVLVLVSVDHLCYHV